MFIEEEEQSEELLIDTSEDGDDAPAPPPSAPVDPLVELRTELTKVQQQLLESTQANQRILEQVLASRQPAAPVVEEDEEEELSLPDDLVDVLTSGDAKRVKSALSGLGLVDKREVARMVSGSVSQAVKTQSIYSMYPELNDSDSEFTIAVAQEVNRLKARHGGGLDTIETAAENVAERMGVEPVTPKTRRSAAAAGETEAQRQARVRGQQNGQRSRPAGSGTGASEEDQHTFSIVQKLRAAGANISVKGVQERAKKGVQIGGLTRMN